VELSGTKLNMGSFKGWREKMKCKKAQKMFSPYIDEELTSREKEAVGLHLKGCEECRKEMENILTLHQFFASAERFEAPNGFAARVAAGIREEEARGDVWTLLALHPILMRSVGAAFACVVLIVGIISGNLLTGRERTTLSNADVRATFSLDVFEPAPPDSVGGAYIAMMGVQNER
jgi:predicted anti-sigma-YlaC factor YlaD